MALKLLIPLCVAAVLAADAVAAQDLSPAMDPVMAGQGAVLDAMNRANTKRLHREAGLTPPDFAAASRRAATGGRTAQSAPRRESRAELCARIAPHRARLSPADYRTYSEGCLERR